MFRGWIWSVGRPGLVSGLWFAGWVWGLGLGVGLGGWGLGWGLKASGFICLGVKGLGTIMGNQTKNTENYVENEMEAAVVFQSGLLKQNRGLAQARSTPPLSVTTTDNDSC